MAEVLEVAQMLSNQYEPKRVFRWILNIDGIDAFTATMFGRPSRDHEETEIHYINNVVYFAGKHKWNTIDLTLNDPISPSEAQKVTQWLQLQYNSSVGRMGYKDFYTKTVTLKMLGPDGTVVEEWRGKNVWASKVDFGGDLDYSKSEVAKIKCTLRADEWSLLY